MGITGLHHASLLVADTDRALGFYRDVLGLTPLPRPVPGFPGAWLGVGGQQIHLLELPDPDPSTDRPGHGGRDRHIALVVDELEPLVRRLQAAGVEYHHSRSGRQALFCRDPDGNAIELLEAE